MIPFGTKWIFRNVKYMKGGKFTINQLMNLFNIFTNGQDYKTTPFKNIEILDKNNYYLYNNRFHVYVLFNSFVSISQIKKDMKSLRIVAIHRGTIMPSGFRTRKHQGITEGISRLAGSMKDWTNNLRNFLDSKTYRREKAKKGHDELISYLTDLMNFENIEPTKDINIAYMNLLIFSCLQEYKSRSNAVALFLKDRLSTLGFSQGAIYAYLYGGEGKETIVYNPAPFYGKKPKNTFLLKTEDDLVSYFVKSDGLPTTIKKTKKWYNVIENHNNDILLNDYQKIGDGLFTQDTDLK